MAQSKEYSKNDFLYSGYTNDISCNLTDVQWDDLIQEKCNTFATGTPIPLTINGKTYTVTTGGPEVGEINTISEIANQFKKITPYNFSYNSAGNYLSIDAAKITFNVYSSNRASMFLGYKEDDLAHNKLPYTFPNKIKITATADYASLYAFDSSYNIKLNDNKKVDIRAAPDKPYYSDKSLVSGLSDAITNPVYVNNLQLVRHLNKKMIGYGESPSESSTDIGNCFYKFAYDYSTSKLIVSDLILYSKPTVTGTQLTLKFTVCSTDTTGTVNSTKDYTYIITPPSEHLSDKATSVNDVVLDGTVFRKFDYTSDTSLVDNNVPTTPTVSIDDTTEYNKKKVTAPAVRLDSNDTVIKGAYENGLFVCYLNNTEIPTFQIAFESISGNPILMCSGSKYVKITDLSGASIYYTLPYTKKITGNADGSASEPCKLVQRNKSLCDNKKSAQTIMDKTQKHTGFDQQYIDAKGFSDMSVLNIINLGIGIIAAAYFIAKTYK